MRRQVDLFRTAHGRSHGRSRVVQAINLGEAHFLTDDPDKNARGLEWLRTARREAAAASLVDLTAAALRGLINQLTLLCEACASESSMPTGPPASEASVALGCRDTWLREAFQCRCELRQVMERMRGTPQADECPISLQSLDESSLVVVLEVSPCIHPPMSLTILRGSLGWPRSSVHALTFVHVHTHDTVLSYDGKGCVESVCAYQSLCWGRSHVSHLSSTVRADSQLIQQPGMAWPGWRGSRTFSIVRALEQFIT